MQHEIKEKGRLLNSGGNLAEAGWAKDLLLQYDRKDIKAGKHRIK